MTLPKNKRKHTTQADTRRVKKEIKTLESKLATADRNLVLLDAKRMPVAEKTNQAMEERLAELKAESRHQLRVQDINSSVQQVLGKLYRLSLAMHPRFVKPVGVVPPTRR